MTENEWLAATDPTPMLEFVREKTSDRKLRLFAVGCCHRIWHLLVEPGSRDLVDMREAFADGLVNWDEYTVFKRRAYDSEIGRAWSERARERGIRTVLATGAAWAAAGDTTTKLETNDSVLVASIEAADAASETVGLKMISDDLRREILEGRGEFLKDILERESQAEMTRCIFGNPFRLINANPSWLSSTAVAIAQGIYDHKAFDRLPILADALQDAGCEDADVLAHCRGDGPHVRGCWVVDLVLGKQ